MFWEPIKLKISLVSYLHDGVRRWEFSPHWGKLVLDKERGYSGRYQRDERRFQYCDGELVWRETRFSWTDSRADHLARAQQVLEDGTFKIPPKFWYQTFNFQAQVLQEVFVQVAFCLLNFCARQERVLYWIITEQAAHVILKNKSNII